MRRIVILGIYSALLVAAGSLIASYRVTQASAPYATAYDADVNHDGTISVQDAQFVFGQYLAGVRPPTTIPVGGGREFVLARDVVVAPGVRTQLGSIDTSECPGSVFYIAAQALDAIRSTMLTVWVNDQLQGGGALQVDAGGNRFLVQDFNGSGTSVLQNHLNWRGVNPTSVSLQANASIGIPVRATLEVHCQPKSP